jgi:hypothetical protein
LKEKVSNPKQSLINESDYGQAAGSANIMKAEVPLMRFNAPIAIFGGCYSNFEATVALIQHIDRLGIPASHRICTVISLRTEPMRKLVSNWCAVLPITS